MILRYTVKPEEAGKRLSSILHYQMRISVGMIKRLKYQTVLYVNDIPVHTNYLVKSGDTVSVPLPAEQADFPPEPGTLRILYEDEAIICLHKPAGIIIHPSATRNTGTLANQLLYYLGGGTVHCLNRLDRDTTGVAVFAKYGYIKSILTEELRKARIQKTYIAPTFGSLPGTKGVIDLPIDRLSTDSLWRTIREDGAPSRTAYKLLAESGDFRLYAFHPLTGRTHQIRLHAFASGAPLLGDPVYATPESTTCSQALGLQVQQLCCTEMTFRHPLTEKVCSITTVPDFYAEPWFSSIFLSQGSAFPVIKTDTLNT